MYRIAAALALAYAMLLGSCGGSNDPAERTRPAPERGSDQLPVACGCPAGTTCGSGGQCDGPFAFRRGTPREALHAYATATWGGDGDRVFTSPATVHTGHVTSQPGDEALVNVLRYAVVDVTSIDGYWIRDLGERARVESMAAQAITGGATRDLVLDYWIDDEDRTHGYSHRVLEIWSFTPAGPTLRFTHEIATAALCCGSEADAPPEVADSIAITPGKISISVRSAWRAQARTWLPRALAGVPPTLAPWDRATTSVFSWDGSQFR